MAVLKMTADLRSRLSGLLPMSQKGRVEFTPVSFIRAGVPDEYCPVFVLRSWTRSEYQEMRRFIDKPGTILKYARLGVTGWRNVYDLADMELIDYVDTDETWALIPENVVYAIFRELCKISGLYDEEKQGLK